MGMGELVTTGIPRKSYTSPVSNQVPSSRDCDVTLVGYSFLRMNKQKWKDNTGHGTCKSGCTNLRSQRCLIYGYSF
jgi:hypothetical protein